MWIITHDNVHEAESNPAGGVPKSSDYLKCVTEARCMRIRRRHIFRLICKGRELFRGIAYLPKDATFKEILRPLDEFGRTLYDCDAIDYQLKDLSRTPTGRLVWNRVPENAGREFDEFADGRAYAYIKLTTESGGATCEATEEMIRRIME